MLLISVPIIIAFVLTVALMPFWIRYASVHGVVGKDMNKPGRMMVAEAGGLVVMGAIVLGLLSCAGIMGFYSKNRQAVMVILGAVGTVVLVGVIGILDDFRGWKVGLKQWQKPLLTIPAALPFVLVNLARTSIDIPFVGFKNVGIVFPLLFVPMAVVGASNAFNMLAGYNGLEAGMGMIILGTFSILSYLNGQAIAVVFCLIGFFALGGFLIFNWYPARVFPGDTLTYPVGAFIAIAALLGRVEKFALVLFIPYFLDFILTMRKRMKVEAFGKVNPDGSLDQPYDGIYDSAHLVISVLQRVKKKVYERDVVIAILGFEFVLSLACIAIALVTG